MTFDFSTATSIRFGPGASLYAVEVLREAGAERACVVTGGNPARAKPVVDTLIEAGIQVTPISISREPTVDDARAAVFVLRSGECDSVVAVGGGSALDLGKAAAMLAANSGDPLDYLEGIGRGLPFLESPLPFVAVPTTAGTGSEVTKNAVLRDPAVGVKASLRHRTMLPLAALVDPDLLASLPRGVIATSGMDALVQLMEPLVSTRANPMVDAIAKEGLRRSARSLVRAFEGTDDPAIREDLAFASLAGGIALSNAGLGAVHGFAGVIGGMMEAPHGAVCGALAAQVTRFTVERLAAEGSGAPALATYAEIASILGSGGVDATAFGGSVESRAERARSCADLLERIARTLEVARLGALGMRESDIPTIAAKAVATNGMKTHPVRFETAELEAILRAAL